MLTQSLNDNLKNIEKKSLRTKASKFGGLFTVQSKGAENDAALDELYGSQKLAKFVRKQEKDTVSKSEVSEDVMDMKDYIVEDPHEINLSVPLVSPVQIDEKLPFFKSITYKLSCIYG
ncbi:hypothetical protein HDR58_10010 [bacterium]|nr:hypothetical protein [bacterium]